MSSLQPEHLSNIFNEVAHAIRDLTMQKFIAWSIFFGLLGVFLSKHNKKPMAYLFALICSIPIGGLAGQWGLDHGWYGGQLYALVAITALIAQDGLKLILQFVGLLQKNGDTIFQVVIEWVRSRFSSNGGGQ